MFIYIYILQYVHIYIYICVHLDIPRPSVWVSNFIPNGLGPFGGVLGLKICPDPWRIVAT